MLWFYLFLSFLLGFMYYGLGRLLFSLGFKKFGFYLVALSIAPDLGIFSSVRDWMIENCPYPDDACVGCKLWTCECRSRSLEK